jgi:hypothetical protein
VVCFALHFPSHALFAVMIGVGSPVQAQCHSQPGVGPRFMQYRHAAHLLNRCIVRHRAKAVSHWLWQAPRSGVADVSQWC